jgi:hypothetical protein
MLAPHLPPRQHRLEQSEETSRSGAPAHRRRAMVVRRHRRAGSRSRRRSASRRSISGASGAARGRRCSTGTESP